MTEKRFVDTDHQADEAWILNVQRKLYQWSKANPDDAWRDMWNWVTDPRNLRCAWRRDWERYQATPLMSDGSEGPPLELRPLFEQFHAELFEHIHMEAR
jgi:retron-type reverse transcriptase